LKIKGLGFMNYKIFTSSDEEVSLLRNFADEWGFWSVDDVLRILERESVFLYYTESFDSARSPIIESFIFFQKSDICTDLLYIAVHSECRKLGLGEKIFNEMVSILKDDENQKTLFLEVRMSNVSAQKLYEKVGMHKAEVKKSYYANGEDALIYRMNLNL
jgi:GNAT superfamily N-acetyltransferase